MKKIYLVRHGKALKQEGFLDAERPLVPEGIKEAYHAARYLRNAGVTPTLLLSSPARRAADTAKIFCEEWQRPIESIQINERIYTDDQEGLWRLLRALDDQHETICLFGHNPSFEELARLLTKHYDRPLPTGGIVGISCPVEFWRDLQKQKNTFDFLESLPQISPIDAEKQTQKSLQIQISQKIEEALYTILPEISSKMKEIIEQASKKLAKQKKKNREKKDVEESEKSSKQKKPKKSEESGKSEKQKKVNLKHLTLFGRCKGCKRKPKSISPKILEKIARNLHHPQHKPEPSPANPREKHTSSPSLDTLYPTFAPPATEPAPSAETHSFDAFVGLPQEATPSDLMHTSPPNTDTTEFHPSTKTDVAAPNEAENTDSNEAENTQTSAPKASSNTDVSAPDEISSASTPNPHDTPNTETPTQTSDLTATIDNLPSPPNSSVDAAINTDEAPTSPPLTTNHPPASHTPQRRSTKNNVNNQNKKPKTAPSSKNNH